MVTLAPLTYGKVVGRFLAIIGDGLDADTSPDAVPLSGTVIFKSGAPALLVASATPDPATIIPTAITATLDVNGYLTFNGAQGVYLLATNDSSQNPTAYTYTATFNFTYLGTPVSYPSFSFSLPAGSTTDLTTVAPSPASSGTGTGGGGTWGSIIGTLSAQTDLNTALGLKAADNSVVHLAGTESVTGTKTFTAINVPTATAGDNTTKAASTAFVTIAVAAGTRPSVMVPVDWNSSSSLWQYNGTTISARPADMQSRDRICFIGNPGGSLPAWAASQDIWIQG